MAFIAFFMAWPEQGRGSSLLHRFHGGHGESRKTERFQQKRCKSLKYARMVTTASLTIVPGGCNLVHFFMAFIAFFMAWLEQVRGSSLLHRFHGGHGESRKSERFHQKRCKSLKYARTVTTASLTIVSGGCNLVHFFMAFIAFMA